jgi:diguanylate cyclase (GGDEF)-like protein
MHGQQVLLLSLEAVVMATIILGLFRARTILGLTPLYIVLGGFQFLEATLNLKVEVADGIWVYPASAVLFTASLVTVLLVYIKEDALEARRLVYGLVLANVSVSIISLIIGLHLALPDSRAAGASSQDFFAAARVSGVGTTLLFLDVLGIILVYEFISRFVRKLFLRFCGCMLIIVAFDSVFFTSIVQWGNADWMQMVIAAFLGKAVGALFYSTIFAVYLRFADPQTAATGTGDVADVFQALTYRQKYEQARDRMVRDGLTGLFNRGYFDEALPQAFARAQRHHEPLSLLILDIDHFKSINDDFSHMEGDRVIRLIATTLRHQARANDVPCRYGGDEFVVLLSHADAESARAFAERVRVEVRERCRMAVPPLPHGAATMTIGIATYPADADVSSPDDLVRLADRRLYAGKHAGRDRVVIATA